MHRNAAKSKRLRPRPAPVIRPAAEVVETFTAELWRGRRPSIEAALDEAARGDWPDLLRTLLRAEVADRRARGETPVAREYLPRFPAHTEVVRAVLPNRSAAEHPPNLPPPAGRPGPLPAWVRDSGNPESQAVLAFAPEAPMAAAIPAADPPPVPAVAPVFALPPRRRRLLLRLVCGLLLTSAVGTGVWALFPPPARQPAGPPPTAAPPVAAPAPPGPGPKVPARPKAPVDPERDLAEWVLALGGRGELQPEGGLPRPFGPDAPVPKTRFAVTALALPPEAAGAWPPSELSRLAGRRKLNSVRLHAAGPLTEADLAPLAGRPLRTLELYANPVQVSGAFCASFPDLQVLTLMDAPDLGDADLVAVGRLTRLSALSLNSPKLTAEGFKAIRSPVLKTLAFGNRVALIPDHIRVLQRLGIEEFESAAGMTDEAFLEFALLPELKRVRLRKTALTDDGLKAVVGLGKLEELRVQGSAVTGRGLEHLAECPRLAVLDLSSGRLTNDSLEEFLALPALRELRLAGSPISDRGAIFLAQLERVELLDLGETAVTDAALGDLAKHPTLKTLVVTNTRVTAPAIAEFEAATRGCKVVAGRRK